MLSIRKARGRLFQIRGPTAPKLLSPKLLCVCGTAHMLSEEDRRAWTMSQLLLYDLHRLDVSRALGGGGCDCSPEPSVNVPRWSLCSRLRPHLWSATLYITDSTTRSSQRCFCWPHSSDYMTIRVVHVWAKHDLKTHFGWSSLVAGGAVEVFHVFALRINEKFLLAYRYFNDFALASHK